MRLLYAAVLFDPAEDNRTGWDDPARVDVSRSVGGSIKKSIQMVDGLEVLPSVYVASFLNCAFILWSEEAAFVAGSFVFFFFILVVILELCMDQCGRFDRFVGCGWARGCG